MKTVKINTEYITLGQLLKMLDLISSGGEAKFFLATTTVLINDIQDQRRGKKIYPKDRVEILGITYKIDAK